MTYFEILIFLMFSDFLSKRWASHYFHWCCFISILEILRFRKFFFLSIELTRKVWEDSYRYGNFGEKKVTNTFLNMKTQLSLLRIKVSVVCVAFFCLVLLLEVRKEFKNKIHICGIFSSHLKGLSGQPKKSYFFKKKSP